MTTRAIGEILERVKENPNGIGDADLWLHARAVEELRNIRSAVRLLASVDLSAPISKEVATRASEVTDLLAQIAEEHES